MFNHNSTGESRKTYLQSLLQGFGGEASHFKLMLCAVDEEDGELDDAVQGPDQLNQMLARSPEEVKLFAVVKG